MKRSGPLKRTGGLRRTRLSPVSSKRRGEADERAWVRSQVHARDRWCVAERIWPEVACGGPLDVDEIQSRAARPGGHLDPANCQLLCRSHHRAKHENPQRAHELGLLRWSWEN